MNAPYRVLITGSRDWTDWRVIRDALDVAIAENPGRPITIVHGACPRGADRIAHAWAASRPANQRPLVSTESHPADWAEYGKRAGFIRNAHMVNLGADLCLAFIRNGSRGATHTADLAEKAGIPVRRWTA